MARTSESAKWYLPLVSGTELAARAPELIQANPDDVLGELPIICQPPGLLLWLDSTQVGSGRAERWQDRSTFGNHAVQLTPSLQPLSAGGVDFKD